MVVPVVHKNVARGWVDSYAVYVAEIAGTSIDGTTRRSALRAPLHQKLSVLVELRHARSGVSVGDEERPVGQPVDVCRAVEMRGVGAGHFGRADGLQQLAAIVGEPVDHLHV